MKLLHFSDIHLTTPGKTIAGRDPNVNFERALAHALECHSDADLLAITGDLSDWGDAADYARLKARLAELPLPVALCIGNHDKRAAFLATFPEARDELGFAQGVMDVAGYRCLMLDSVKPESHGGLYCAARFSWLEAQLEVHPGPFLLFLHHNPMPTFLAPFDAIGLEGAEDFRALLAQHKAKVRHVFFGHCHLPFSGSIGGVPCSSLRGTNHQSFPQYAERQMLSVAALPEAYGVVHLAPDFTSVVMVEFGFSGPIQSDTSPEYAAWDRETMAR